MLKSHHHFVLRTVVRSTVVLIMLMFFAGCAINAPFKQAPDLGIPPSASEQTSTSAEVDQILAFVESAPISGQTGIIEMLDGAAPVHVRVERIYESASGSACRRYNLSVSELASTTSSHLACLIDGRWLQVRQLLNPGLLSGSSTQKLGG